jgi:hypothetical protein
MSHGDFTWFDDDYISDAAPPALQGAFLMSRDGLMIAIIGGACRDEPERPTRRLRGTTGGVTEGEEDALPALVPALLVLPHGLANRDHQVRSRIRPV